MVLVVCSGVDFVVLLLLSLWGWYGRFSCLWCM